jgi:hypothetical protein
MREVGEPVDLTFALQRLEKRHIFAEPGQRPILRIGAHRRRLAHHGRGIGPGWGGGINYWRVIYTAGYATVPEDVQEACAQWVAALFWQSKRDPGLALEQIPGVARIGKTLRLRRVALLEWTAGKGRDSALGSRK